MLDIILLYFLLRNIGSIADNKGLKPLRWKLITIGFWFLAELIGIIVGLMIFSIDNFISIMLLAFGFAFTSYYIVKSYLQKIKPLDKDHSL